MDIQSSVLNELFVLYPVIIQGWVSPLKPANLAHGGIPKSLYDGQPQGLECLVDPWTELQLFSWTMAVDDRVDLYVNDDPTPVTGKTVAPGEEQQRIRLYVPHGRLRNGVNRLHYKVIRPGGGSEDSRDLNVLYYLRSPGEPAPNGLDLVIPPDVIKDGVSAARAAQGVEFGFTYSNRRAYDRIRFQLGDESVDWEITDASTPVTKTLFTDTFQRVGDNPNLLLDFVVFDQLGNFNRSSTKQIDVHLGRVNLSAAILREIPTENNDDPNTVDLAKLNGNPLSALIHLVETIWKVGDSIKLAFTAELNGSVVATHEETSPVAQVPSQFLWSIPNNKIIANSTVTVVYEQVRNDTVIATSTPATAQVIGKTTEPVKDIDLGRPQRANAISPDGTRLYVGHVGAISVIDISTNRLIDTIVTPNTGFFWGFVLTPDGAKLYGAVDGTNEVLVIDTLSNKVIKRVAVGGQPVNIIMNPRDNSVVCHAGSSSNGSVRVIDTRTDQIIKTFPTGSFTRGAAISLDGQRFYYVEHQIHNLVVMDLTTGRRLKSTPVPKTRGSVYLSRDGLRLYLPSYNDTPFSLLEMEASTLRLLRNISPLYPSNQYTAAFNPEGTRLYLCGSLNKIILAMDLASGAIVRTYQTGSKSQGISCTHDGKRLYACNAGNNFVTVVATD
ncbi:YncE family protein [Pseudomonas sp. LT1P18]|uniref:YncE family protein n=1 Tax=Pseudomonas arabinosi TaxID=3398357 RepID=UPI0039F07960